MKDWMLVTKQGMTGTVYHVQVKIRIWFMFYRWKWVEEVYNKEKGWCGEYKILEKPSGWFCHFMDAIDSLKRMQNYDL